MFLLVLERVELPFGNNDFGRSPLSVTAPRAVSIIGGPEIEAVDSPGLP